MATGGCQCGAVRFTCADAPLAVYVCHCLECRRQSASAFGISVQVPRASLRVSAGSPSTWLRRADSGNAVICRFCPTCGSRLWHEPADAGGRPAGTTVTVKGGALDTPPDLAAAIHIWTCRKLPGVPIPDGARQHSREPPA